MIDLDSSVLRGRTVDDVRGVVSQRYCSAQGPNTPVTEDHLAGALVQSTMTCRVCGAAVVTKDEYVMFKDGTTGEPDADLIAAWRAAMGVSAAAYAAQHPDEVKL